jgi:hypothetical protein
MNKSAQKEIHMNMVLKFLPAGILFLLTVCFGLWLSRIGKPYNGLLFNIHKLIALGVVIFTVIKIIDVFKGMEIQALLIALIAVAGICVVALFVSGALMSAGHPAANKLLIVHHIAPVLLTVSMSLTIYMLSAKSV